MPSSAACARLSAFLVFAALPAPAFGVDCILPLTSHVGEHPNAYFGNAIAGGGDFNGDGYEDVLVGSERYNIVGRAYMFFGGPGTHTTPDLVFGGNDLSGVRFGTCVGWAGDVNGDGYDDILVGDPMISLGGGKQGQVFLYYGGATPDTTRDRRFWALNSSQTRFGTSVSGADFNGDGYDDVVIGEPGGTYSAYVYFGGPSMDESWDVQITLPGAQQLGFGTSVAGLGDFNGDGFDDIAIGHIPSFGTTPARVHIAFGGAVPNGTVDVTHLNPGSSEYFGAVLAGPGDVDGDGQADLLVGAPPTGAAGGGRAYLYPGGAGVPYPSPRVHVGAPLTRLGYAVAGCGDLDGDGRPEYLLGAPGTGTIWDPPGEIQVHSWSAGELCRYSGLPGELFGHAVGASPQFFGPGAGALFAGAPWNDTAGADAGRLWVGAFAGTPVSATASLVRIGWTGDRVEVVWHTSSRGVGEWQVERHDSDDGWRTVGPLIEEGPDRLRFEDFDLERGRRYGYRLWRGEDGARLSAGEAWLEIPAHEALILHGFQPNPARGTPVLVFTLPEAGETHLEAFDVAGRRCLLWRGSLAAGLHRMALADLAGAAPGVYRIRLAQGGRAHQVLGIVTR